MPAEMGLTRRSWGREDLCGGALRWRCLLSILCVTLPGSGLNICSSARGKTSRGTPLPSRFDQERWGEQLGCVFCPPLQTLVSLRLLSSLARCTSSP